VQTGGRSGGRLRTLLVDVLVVSGRVVIQRWLCPATLPAAEQLLHGIDGGEGREGEKSRADLGEEREKGGAGGSQQQQQQQQQRSGAEGDRTGQHRIQSRVFKDGLGGRWTVSS
jgi:hypothetical protein